MLFRSQLNLGSNQLSGVLPHALGYFTHLRELHLTNNSFSGPILSSIQHLSRLETLDFSNNLMNGTIPEFIGQLIELSTLDLFSNSMTETNFLNLKKLTWFSFSSTRNSLVLSVTHDWTPPFSLQVSKLETANWVLHSRHGSKLRRNFLRSPL